MTKQDLVKAVAEKAGISLASANSAVSAAVEATTEALAAGDELRITGFGTFSVAERPARTGRNPQTGEEIKIAASRLPRFKPGKGLKDAVNG